MQLAGSPPEIADRGLIVWGGWLYSHALRFTPAQVMELMVGDR